MRSKDEGWVKVDAETPSLVARQMQRQLSKDGGGKLWGRFGRKIMSLGPVTLKQNPWTKVSEGAFGASDRLVRVKVDAMAFPNQSGWEQREVRAWRNNEIEKKKN